MFEYNITGNLFIARVLLFCVGLVFTELYRSRREVVQLYKELYRLKGHVDAYITDRRRVAVKRTRKDRGER